jgi:hypothetical protein
MSVTLNAKGTTVPHFTIGKTGTTFYQGASDPYPVYTPKNGDYWFDSSLNALHVWSSTATNWVAPRLADLTFTSSTIATAGADITLQSNGTNAKVVFAGDVGPGLITASAGQDLYIDPTLGGGNHLVLIDNRWPTADGTAGQTLFTDGSGLLYFGNAPLGPVNAPGWDSVTSAAPGYIPVSEGAPAGVPSPISGYAPMVADSSGNKIWVYINGAWKYATLT